MSPTLSRPVGKQQSDTENFFAPCPRGLAPVLADELRALGAVNPEAGDAGVSFTGAFDVVYDANLRSRIASRVLWRVARFPYKKEDDIYEGAKNVAWREHFSAERTFKVETNAHRAPVKSLDFITLRVKDGIADHFRNALGRRPSVAPRDPDVRVHVFLDAHTCTLYLDTSGEPLFKRGRRDAVGEAPLKKNLAAGILNIAGWKPGVALLDPMCGGGTFLSEAAEISLGRSPGRERSFGFQKLARFNSSAWERVLARAQREEQALDSLPIFGSDLYGRSLDAARMNLREAGLDRVVNLKQVNLLELSSPARSGMIVTNPPYGVRLGEKEKLAEFYPKLGDVLKKKFADWHAFIFSGDPDLPRLIRLSPSRKTVLYNGALECRLYEYRMVPGGNRPEVNGETLLRLALVPAAVWLASLAARRWGHAVSGYLGGLPLIGGPITFYLAVDHGTDFAARSAMFTLAAILGQAVHLLAFAYTARGGRWGLSLLAGWSAFAVVSIALAWLPLTPLAALGVALAGLALAWRFLPRALDTTPPPLIPPAELWLRLVAAFALAVVIVASADAFGPVVSGVLLSVPVTGSIMPPFTLALYGPNALARLMRGFVVGLTGFTAFFFVLAAFLPAWGIATAFVTAVTGAVAVVFIARHLSSRNG